MQHIDYELSADGEIVRHAGLGESLRSRDHGWAREVRDERLVSPQPLETLARPNDLDLRREALTRKRAQNPLVLDDHDRRRFGFLELLGDPVNHSTPAGIRRRNRRICLAREGEKGARFGRRDLDRSRCRRRREPIVNLEIYAGVEREDIRDEEVAGALVKRRQCVEASEFEERCGVGDDDGKEKLVTLHPIVTYFHGWMVQQPTYDARCRQDRQLPKS